MNHVFILQNQHKLFFGKNKEWVDGYDANSLFKTPYKDEAINQRVEISAKDYQQRVTILTCELNEKGLPILAEDLMPAPLPKAPKAGKEDDLFSALEPTDDSAPITTTELAAPSAVDAQQINTNDTELKDTETA